MSRDFDLVLFGATGFTGGLTAAWIASRAPDGMAWAIAGRSEARLRAVRDQLAAADPSLADLPLVVADSSDPDSLAAMASRTKVVCTTVGPYIRYGLPLVAACAEAGTHYCDLTGETPFIRQSIDGYDALARERGARIVHCCGYDSIPSDLGTLMVQEAMTAAGAPAHRVTTVVGPSRGGVSGGTAHSMLAVMEAGADKKVRRVVGDPYGLDPRDDRGTARVQDQAGPAYRDDVAQWTMPFVMAIINTRVVRRSHALLGRPWGEDFVYDETMAVGRGWKGRARAWGFTGALGTVMGLAMSGWGRSLLAKTLLPAPGDGPDAEARDAGYFRHLLLAEGEGHRMLGRVVGQHDPGYGETARMLGETALALALDEADLPDRAGVLTPATALGMHLVERLRGIGMTWSVEPWPEDGPPRP